MKNLCQSVVMALVVPALASCATTTVDVADLSSEVADVERAFAATMAARDHGAFESFLSDEAVFISGPVVLRGRSAVADHWRVYFTGSEPPFSWLPETVTVLDSGKLALSSGPVWNAQGERMATFTSIWRREASGEWRIVFDKGAKYCE